MPISSELKACLVFNRNKVALCLSFQCAGILFFLFFMCGICSSLFLSLCDFLFSLTADKINNLTSSAPAACWITPCFCCDFEAWKDMKAGPIWSRQEYLCATLYCFYKTGSLLDKLLFLLPCAFVILVNVAVFKAFSRSSIFRNAFSNWAETCSEHITEISLFEDNTCWCCWSRHAHSSHSQI